MLSSTSRKRQKEQDPKEKVRRKEALICDGRVLHFASALNAKDLVELETFLSSSEVQKNLGEAVLHDSTEAQYGSRKCSSAWLPLSALAASIIRKLKKAVKEAQAHFEVLPRTRSGALMCKYEDVQYCEYKTGGHFQEWHVDADDDGIDDEDGRELTIVCLLAEPDIDFQGGTFQVMSPSYPNGHDLPLRKGDLIAFQAKKLWHRVLPTTHGTRKSLVLWAKHPNYTPSPPPNENEKQEHD